MNIVIRDSPLWLFCYWKKSVKGGLGRSSQNDRFIVVIGTQCRLVLSPGNHVNWLQVENNRLITDFYTTEIIQIPIGIAAH